MLKRLQTAPRWVFVLLNGVPFGAVMAVFGAVTMTNLTVAGRVYVGVVIGLIGGASFGLIMAWFTSRQISSRRTVDDDVPDALRQAATRSAWRGPAPADHVVRRAALRVVEGTREVNDRRWRSTTVIFACLSLLYVALALTGSPWWWLAFGLVAALLGLQLTLRRLIKRRVAILSEGLPTAE